MDHVTHTPSTDPIHAFLPLCARSFVYILYCLQTIYTSSRVAGLPLERGRDKTLHSPLHVILFRAHLRRREVRRVQCYTLSPGEAVHSYGVIVYTFVEGDC